MRVLVFGDSITQGFWDSKGGWVTRLRRVYDQKAIDSGDYDIPTFFNLGVSGDSSDDVLKRLDNETNVRATEEVAFIISVGVNDSRIKAGVNYSDTSRYKQNLKELVSLAQNYSDKILFVGLTPCVEERSNPVSWGDTGYTNARLKDFDNTLQQFCQENHLAFADVYQPFWDAMEKTELLPDSLHPNDAGHQLIAGIVTQNLGKVLHG